MASLWLIFKLASFLHGIILCMLRLLFSEHTIANLLNGFVSSLSFVGM